MVQARNLAWTATSKRPWEPPGYRCELCLENKEETSRLHSITALLDESFGSDPGYHTPELFPDVFDLV